VAAASGDVQIVVNHAGIGRPAIPLTATIEDARAQLEVNYLPLLATTQAFAPVLAANGGGAFVNVLSVVSWIGMPSLATYSASKSAAWSFTNSARVELKRQDTQVVGVHVGFVDTDLTAGLDTDKIRPPPSRTPRSTRWRPGRRSCGSARYFSGLSVVRICLISGSGTARSNPEPATTTRMAVGPSSPVNPVAETA
jgi:NAD(P)-dependent dehydrogenase (short-subunit alcohol dehydrogenase family)